MTFRGIPYSKEHRSKYIAAQTLDHIITLLSCYCKANQTYLLFYRIPTLSLGLGVINISYIANIKPMTLQCFMRKKIIYMISNTCI